MRYTRSLESLGFIGGPTLPPVWVTSDPELNEAVAVADPLSSALGPSPIMASFTPIDTDTLVNSNTADGQISPKVAALADGRYMIVWVGAVTQPVVSVDGTFAPAYANAGIRAQIFNADGTRSGGEIVINTTTAGAQLRPVVAQLSDGNVLISWHDGVGPAGGSAETTPNTIRAQEFTSAGVASGAEFAIGNSNGRLHSVSAMAGGGFVVTYQEGGIGGTLAAGNFVARIYDSNNLQTSTFVVDNTQPIGNHNGTYTSVEADGDIVIYWTDRDPVSNLVSTRGARFDANGNMLSSDFLQPGGNFGGVVTLATGGHAIIEAHGLGNGQPVTIYARMFSVDGSLEQYVEVAQVPTLLALPTITAAANGGFIASWIIDSDPSSGFNAEIVARAFNAIGNPIGSAFQVNSITPGNQTPPAMVQLTNGDIIAVWSDDSHLTGDTSGTGINMRRVHYDPANHNPTAADFEFSLYGIAPGTSVTEDPANIEGFFGPNGYDADGDPLALSSVSNISNGTVTLNPDGTLTMTATPGAPERLSFDFVVSDGQGGTATARATVTLPSDFVTVRLGSTATVDFLANDYYKPAPGATAFTVSSAGPVMGGSVQGFTTIVNTANGPRIVYDPLAATFGPAGSVDLNSSFFNLLAGQTAQYRMSYYNNQTAAIDVIVTVQGWAQLGGTAADNLVGTALADHLSGGSGAANTLQGGAGDDWYTVAVANDTIIELADEGIDSVRTALAVYTLPDNVENLRFLYNSSSYLQRGIGNALDNLITIGPSNTGELYGLGGNDTLIGSGLFVGGAGADTMIGSVATIDTASYADSPGGVSINLATNVNVGSDAEGDTLTSIERIIGSAFADTIVGSSGDNILDGGTGINILLGGAGNDRLIVGAGADGTTVDGGADFDTLVVTGSVSLGGLTGIEAIELQSGAVLTLTGAQFNTLAPGTALSGTGSITIDMAPGDLELNAQNLSVAPGSNVSFTINGSSGGDAIKGSIKAVNTILGGDGDDQIRGGSLSDTIDGGNGDDKIIGARGADILTGGAGADQFRYLASEESGIGVNADRITDFTSGTDKLAFRLLDSDPNTPGVQGFSYIDSQAFHATGAAEIRYGNSGSDLVVQLDLNGDGVADMEIFLDGLAGHPLTGGDFLL